MTTTAVARGERLEHGDRRELDGAAMRWRVLMFVAMIAAIVLVSIMLYVDARREGVATLDDFAHEQRALAAALAIKVDGGDDRAMARLEESGEVIVLQSHNGKLQRPNGAAVESGVIVDAVARGEHTHRLSRAEAASLGLPERTAVAGIARTQSGAVVVVASALRVRDRESRALNRLMLGIALVTLLVIGFGGAALRIQRNEHALERALLVREIEKVGEERLARADKLATMGAFATGIAHEIATPLGVIATRADMIATRAPGDDRSPRSALAILDQAEKIHGIIRSFLALARGESTTQTRIAVRALLSSAKTMVEHRFAAARVVLDVDDPAQGLFVFGEPRLLEQAIVNLLLNACDASNPSQHVRLSAHADAERVRFVVDDDGAGISRDVAARATEPFFTTKPAGAGTGLGLAIVNEIAKHHQGRFSIGPRPEGGTEARLDVPKAKDQHS